MNTTITNMNFIRPISVAGRTVECCGTDYAAEMREFPWVAVWSKSDPSRVRLTTVFNVRDCDVFEELDHNGRNRAYWANLDAQVPAPATTEKTKADGAAIAGRQAGVKSTKG